ncbi:MULTISPECIES: VOC family protein [unclassified Sphingobium]|uniref:VOC family protein n=1 Tax=unclassified Sphingobium TaxID=2611147 RepID=UPI000D17E809|nr:MULTISPECIES: VOC family protein [unclassified Sphingobium]MBG6119765.1 catechol 2,3-dioxygenase-like lactoylglutathione lyase family enzyme [Sphingobium sp. JAI105]PSO10594.1 oxidoreductase [Sphingobium sp. AEW4]TWD01192.1 glyoxalase/bleomycin resistance protein/dioxygenase superfamily protein [Sphingobium sp. AEW010]TWD19938.1 glyoxalase/bleomycin resistance protein/dioxygenase superfamily protein [Sphingobium sp. AEW013]TWD22554.1 glyoxalase/bleomycin resistance protein/dioxygenase super
MSRVTEIRYVGYALPDLENERSFYADQWKLVEVGEQDGMVYFTADGGAEGYVVRLRQAEDQRIDVIALAADARADVDALHAKVVASGCRIIFAPKDLDTLGGGYGFRFFSPDGLPFEVSSDVHVRTPRTLDRWEGIPQKISHIVLHSPDHKKLVEWFCDVLGFKLSDWLGDFMAFLRCNSAHHRIAILPGPPCLNHVAYDMLSVDDMMVGINRLRQKGTDIRWGPGRHTAGNNTFSYFTTPAGFAVEYTSELEDVDFEAHEAKVHIPGPKVMDQWGIGVGGPQTMPHPEADKGLFVAVEV